MLSRVMLSQCGGLVVAVIANVEEFFPGRKMRRLPADIGEDGRRD